METRIGIVTTGGADGASISIKEIDASSNGATGAILTAKNISGATVAVNDRGIITRDLDGTLSFFFKSSSVVTPPTPTQCLKIMEYATGYFFHVSGSVYSDMEAMWRIYHPYLYYTGPSMGVTEWFSSNAGAIFEDASWRVTTPFGISGFILIGSGASDGTYTWFVDSSTAQIDPPDNLPPGW